MSDKYKREIEEILKRTGYADEQIHTPNAKLRFPVLIWLSVKQSLTGKVWSFTPGRLMMLAISMLMSALLLNVFGLGIVGPIAWIGLVLFMTGYAMFFLRPRTVAKRWRGQPINDASESFWDRIRHKLK